MRTRFRGAVVGLVAVVATLLALPAPAWAHTELLGTGPADAAVVDSPLNEVTLTFSGPVRADGGSVVVTGPDGVSVSDGPLSVLDFVVHQPVRPLASGAYRVAWSVLAADGHAMTGEFGFQVSLPPELEPAPSPTASPSTATPESTGPTATDTASGAAGGSGSLWPWLAAAVLVLAVIAALILVARRRRHS